MSAVVGAGATFPGGSASPRVNTPPLPMARRTRICRAARDDAPETVLKDVYAERRTPSQARTPRRASAASSRRRWRYPRRLGRPSSGTGGRERPPRSRWAFFKIKVFLRHRREPRSVGPVGRRLKKELSPRTTAQQVRQGRRGSWTVNREDGVARQSRRCGAAVGVARNLLLRMPRPRPVVRTTVTVRPPPRLALLRATGIH